MFDHKDFPNCDAFTVAIICTKVIYFIFFFHMSTLIFRFLARNFFFWDFPSYFFFWNFRQKNYLASNSKRRESSDTRFGKLSHQSEPCWRSYKKLSPPNRMKLITDHSFLIHFPKRPILDLGPSSFLIRFISSSTHF